MFLKIAEWLVWRVVRKEWNLVTGQDRQAVRSLVHEFIYSIPSDVRKKQDYFVTEKEIIFQRLSRLYDPGKAFSEAKNRADALKLGERPVTLPDGDVIIPKLTAKQEMALEFQRTGKIPGVGRNTRGY